MNIYSIAKECLNGNYENFTEIVKNRKKKHLILRITSDWYQLCLAYKNVSCSTLTARFPHSPAYPPLQLGHVQMEFYG
jgi:hypothetical protein